MISNLNETSSREKPIENALVYTLNCVKNNIPCNYNLCRETIIENNNIDKVYTVDCRQKKNHHIRYLTLVIKGFVYEAMIDSGASVSIMSSDILKKTYPSAILKESACSLKSYSGNITKPLGEYGVDFEIDTNP